MSKLTSFKFTQEAYNDYLLMKQREPKLAAKIKELILNIMEMPFEGLGKPEALKFDLSGYWSRRINQQHRLVYRVDNDVAVIVSCRYHYK